MIAHVTGLEAGRFVHSIGDAHIYKNHVGQVHTQLARGAFDPPRLELDGPGDTVDGWTFEQIRLVGYRHHAALKAEVAK